MRSSRPKLEVGTAMTAIGNVGSNRAGCKFDPCQETRHRPAQRFDLLVAAGEQDEHRPIFDCASRLRSGGQAQLRPARLLRLKTKSTKIKPPDQALNKPGHGGAA